jgi:hypothetical protein
VCALPSPLDDECTNRIGARQPLVIYALVKRTYSDWQHFDQLNIRFLTGANEERTRK